MLVCVIMSPPRGILIQSNFLYHIRHKEIILQWFTNRAIFKFTELILSSVALGFSMKVCDTTYDFEFLIFSYTSSNWIICLVLYLTHFFECPAPPYVDMAFTVVAIVAGVVCFAFEIIQETIHGTSLTAILAVGIAIHITELTCSIWFRNHKNFIFRWFNKRKQGSNSSATDLKRKRVKFSTAPVSFREPSEQENSSDDDDDYFYFRHSLNRDDEEKYVPVKF